MNLLPQLSFSVSSWLLLLMFAALAVGLGVFAYRNAGIEKPVVRITLISLRSLAVFLALTLMLEPIASTLSKKVEPPKLAVVIDHSQSLTIQDGQVRRDSLLESLLTANAKNLSSLGDVKFFLGGEKQKTFSAGDIKFSQSTTDISAWLKSVLDAKDRESLNAVLLLSDGNVNAGSSPAYAAEASPIPIYTVVIGDTTEKKDISIKKIFNPTEALVDAKIPVTVLVRQNGFAKEKVEVSISDGKNILDRKSVELGAAETSVSLEAVSKEVGTKKFTVSVSKVAGEFTFKNNDAVIFIDILKSKTRILVLSGSPDPEVSAIRSTLALDKNLEGLFYTEKSGSEFLEGTLDFSTLGEIDVCVLVGFPSYATDSKLAQRVAAYLTEKKLAVFSIVTFSTSGLGLKGYENFLAVKLGRTEFGNVLDGMVFLKPTPQAGSSVIFKSTSGLGNAAPLTALQKAPPLAYLDYNFQPKPAADVLLQIELGNKTTDRIGFALVRTPSLRAATLAVPQFYRFLLSGDDDVKSFYTGLILNTLSLLAAKDDAARFKLEPSAKNFDIEQAVAFSASVQDEMVRPVATASVKLTATNKDTKEAFTLALSPAAEAGFYDGAFAVLPKGDYAFKGDASLVGKSIGTATGVFSVSETGLEFRDPSANADVMREIAIKSGGKTYTPETFAGFFDDLKHDAFFQPAETELKTTYELASMLPVLLVILLLLSAEWLIRKLNNLA
jgi:hypothetical protein